MAESRQVSRRVPVQRPDGSIELVSAESLDALDHMDTIAANIARAGYGQSEDERRRLVDLVLLDLHDDLARTNASLADATIKHIRRKVDQLWHQ